MPKKKIITKKKSSKTGLKTRNSSVNVNEKDEPSPVSFSIEDVEALVAKQTNKDPKKKNEKPKKLIKVKKQKVLDNKKVKNQSHAPASITDILGFNPNKQESATSLLEKEIPQKWKKYYKLLINLRNHVKEELELHTQETLKQSSKDNSGDLSGYSSHQADAGTDNFDRDFALGLLSNEQDALNEIEEAIIRIKNGNYGKCEETGKPINKERLTAVPFARFSLEGQIAFEKNNRKRREKNTPGLFDDSSDSLNLINSGDEE